jgi:hypothetical protein
MIYVELAACVDNSHRRVTVGAQPTINQRQPEDQNSPLVVLIGSELSRVGVCMLVGTT